MCMTLAWLILWTKPETDQNGPEFTQVTTCERGKFQPIASFFQISKKLNKPVSDRGNEMTYSCSVSAISAFRECVPVNIWGIEKYRQDTAITI